MIRGAGDNRAARRAAIFILTVASVLAGVWAVPRASDGAAQWVSAPPVRERTLSLDGGLTVVERAAPETGRGTAGRLGATVGAPAAAAGEPARGAVGPATKAKVLEPGFTFDMLGLLCDVAPPPGTSVTVSLRTSRDGATWSEWCVVDLEGQDATETSTARAPAAFTEPVWVGEARMVELRADAPPGAGTLSLSGVRVMFLNTAGDGSFVDTVATALRSAVATIAGVAAAPPARAMTSTPDIVRRSEWGADESWRGHDPEYAPVRMAFVHHTVNANSYSRAQAAGLVRGIYYYDTKGLKWSDLGYNFLVDRYGTVYEGRYGGITKGVIGAQVLGFNTNSTGVAMIGTFGTATPPSAMMTSLKRLLAWKLDVHHVDPQGQARLTCRSSQKFTEGETVVFPAVAGHRQANYTACPGDALYRLLPGVRTAVGKMGLPKIYEYVVGTTDLSPNGDAVQEGTRIRFRNSAVADWTVEVADAGGDIVRTASGRGDQVDVRWDCRNDAGSVVPDGTYRIVARADVAGARARAATADVRVDTVAPVAGGVGVAPAVFSPNGDGYAERCRLRFTTAEGCSARASVVDAQGTVLRTIAGWQYAAAGGRSIAWDGKVSSSGALVDAAEGKALLRLDLKDAAGNRSSLAATAFVDRTLGFLTAAPGTLSPNGDGVKDSTAVGFSLTRRATVRVAIERAGDVLRSLGSVTYAAGARTATWDGTLADGTRAGSGTYKLRATATSTLGSVAAARTVIVDRYRPRLTAPARITPALGSRAKVIFTVADPYSPKVRVTATVRNRAGTRLAVIDCGWVSVGVRTAVRWKPPARRTYTLTLTAVDRGGNREYAAAETTIAVR